VLQATDQEKDMAEKIEGKVRDLLEAPNVVSVATVGKNGAPDVKVVWADVEDGTVVLNSAEGRVWPENVRRDPRVTITVINPENPYEYGQIHGRVVEDTHEGADENIDRLAKKYLDKDEYPYRQEGEQRVMFRIEPERVKLHGG
jgi:PPOX class probable F420-dependent enzyme